VASELLPVGSASPRCSNFARSLDLRPAGSGLYLSRVVLVSVPLPWPKPALKHSTLLAAAEAVNRSDVRTRLFAAEPVEPHPLVEVFERQGSEAHLFRWDLEGGDEIAALVSAIADAPHGKLAEIALDGATPTDSVDQRPTFLVCTQGSHDVCCGIEGVALADQIERERPNYAVRRVSHTGGHRFSPTLLAFPEGRMWAFADLALVDQIATGTVPAAAYARSARGWWGAHVGAEQVAECAVRAERSEQRFVEPVIEAMPSTEGGLGSDFAVTVEDETWTVTVHIAREVPSIACEAPGGLPAKPGREFGWAIERTTTQGGRI